MYEGHIRDSQKSKVYKWEDGVFDFKKFKIDFDQCKMMTVMVSRDFGLIPPKVLDGSGTKRIHAVCMPDTIVLPKKLQHKWVVLHEMAHYMVQRAYNGTVATHGPEYMAIYINLLSRYLNCDPMNLVRSAMLNRIKVDLGNVRTNYGTTISEEFSANYPKIIDIVSHGRFDELIKLTNNFANEHNIPVNINSKGDIVMTKEG